MQRQKSSEKIIRAFLSLLDQKKLEEIKILDITSVADVSKTTFYSNFENLDSLLESVVESLLCELDNQLQKKEEQGDSSEGFYRLISNYMLEHQRFFQMICQSRYRSDCFSMIHSYMLGIISHHFRFLNHHPKNFPTQISFFAHGYVSYLLEGLEKGEIQQVRDAGVFLQHAVEDSTKREITERMTYIGLRNVCGNCSE